MSVYNQIMVLIAAMLVLQVQCFFAGVRVIFQAQFSFSVNFLKIRMLIDVLDMLIVRHLGTTNSSFNVPSIDKIG